MGKKPSNWAKNKALAITRDTTPTLCDQSQARDTDINIIIKMLEQTGTVPGAKGEPMYGDFTQLPKDLRGFIEKGRELKSLQSALPPQLQGKPLEELMSLTPQALKDILTPAPTPTKEESAK